MRDDLEEFYVVQVRPQAAAGPSEAAFVADDGSLGSFRTARRFASLGEAEAHIAAREDRREHVFLVQMCTRERPTPETPDDGLGRMLRRLMEIPPPYRRTAYNWLRGRNVKALLTGQSQEVFERHRRLLLEHGIDISRPSAVVLMRPRRRRPIPIDAGTGADGPRQYVAAPDQRPTPAPVVTGRGEGDGDQ